MSPRSGRQTVAPGVSPGLAVKNKCEPRRGDRNLVDNIDESISELGFVSPASQAYELFCRSIPGLRPGLLHSAPSALNYLVHVNGAMIFDSVSVFDPSRSSTGYFSPSPYVSW